MFPRSFLASATVALFVSSTLAEPLRQPYKVNAVRMSVRSPASVFGLTRRAATDGYNPADQNCGAGNTCSEACGATYETCASTDGQTHCFDPSAKQTCCSSGSGDACDAGFFCSADAKGATWCCPDNMTLEQCAQAYGLPAGGALTSGSSAPPPPPVATSTATGPTPASSSSSSSGGHTTPPPPVPTTATAESSEPTGSGSGSGAGSGSSSGAGSGAGSAPSATPSPSQILVETSATIGHADQSSCTTFTSAIVETISVPDTTTPLLTAGPQPSGSGTSTILIPVPTVRPSSSTVGVPTPSSTVPIAAGHRVVGGGAGLAACIAGAVAIAGLW